MERYFHFPERNAFWSRSGWRRPCAFSAQQRVIALAALEAIEAVSAVQVIVALETLDMATELRGDQESSPELPMIVSRSMAPTTGDASPVKRRWTSSPV
jgi:hypothetical protein